MFKVPELVSGGAESVLFHITLYCLLGKIKKNVDYNV